MIGTNSFSRTRVSRCGLDLFRGRESYMTQQVKPFTSIADQVAQLSGRGLSPDPAVAQHRLQIVG